MAPAMIIFRMNVLVGRRRFPGSRELHSAGFPTQQLCVSLKAGGLATHHHESGRLPITKL